MFDLKNFLERQRCEVDALLEQMLPAKTERPSVIHEAMRYSLFCGGKRLRPILCWVSAELCGGSEGCADAAAVALECLHTYTLIHDDLPAMDNDDLRRGFPTSHKVYGEAQAILAGDALLTFAFEVLAARPAPEPFSPCALILELACAGGSRGVIGGQVEDLEAEQQTPDEAKLLYIHQHKTARLIEASCRMGCMAAGGTEEQAASLAEYGRCCGLAFQIADDLLDVTSDEATLGKPIGSDRRNEKMTWVTLRGLEAARAEAHRLAQQAVEALAEFDAAARQPLESLARYMVERVH